MITGVQPSKTLKDEFSISQSLWGRSSTDSSLPVELELQQHCLCDRNSDVMLGKGFLTAEVVDVLELMQKDWIIELNPEQLLNMQGGDVRQLSVESIPIKNSRQIVANLVANISLASYQFLEVNGKPFWFVMFSCWIGGWGKVRFIVNCYFPFQKESKSLLVTNRLDWSPSKILKLFHEAKFS